MKGKAFLFGLFFILGTGLSFSILASQVTAKNTPGNNQKSGPAKKIQIPSKFNNAACSSYLDRLRSKMDSNWYLPDGTNHVTIKATVGQNGSVDNVEISSSPKSESAEQAANEAFLKAQPLESLPSGSGERVKLVLDFNSFADPHGDSRRTISSRIEEIRESSSGTKPAEDKKE